MNSPLIIKVTNSVNSLGKLVDGQQYASDECLDCLKRIDQSFNEKDKSIQIELSRLLVELNYPQLALKLIEYYAEQGIFQNDNTWSCTFFLLRSIWNFSDVSKQIAILSIGIIPVLLRFISDDSLQPEEQEEDKKLLKLSLNVMNNIARNPETKVSFQKCDASEALLKLCHLKDDHLRVVVYSILAHIVSESEQEKLNDSSNDIIQSVASFLKESLLHKDKRHKGLSCNEYLDCLAKLSVTKQNKLKIIENNQILSLFKTILINSHHSDIGDEQSNVLVCIWNLSFDEKIRDALKKEKELINLIVNLNNSSPYEHIQRRSAGILFTLNEFKEETKSHLQSKEKQEQKQHIMISYNSGSREMCLKLKDELKSRGHQSVWIDVEQIYGSSLTSMAEAVESASVVLMCISEKYYLSPNCRLEAEYAVRLQKPIIPLIMQEDYMPYGWLGIIIGSKIYYKFTRDDQFETKFCSLLKEIKSYSSVSVPVTSSNTKRSNEAAAKKACEWTNKQVKEWISTLGLSNWIQNSEIFLNINGSMLRELDQVKKTAPDFFFNLIKTKFTSNEHFHLHDLLKFSAELSGLFAAA